MLQNRNLQRLNISEQISNRIRSVIGNGKVILHEPVFDGNEEKYVHECVSTGWVSSVGAFVDRFEEMLRELTGAKSAVAVSNGTSALFVALRLCGIQPNDEVLIPDLTFVATANAVSHCHAVPHLVDCEDENLGIDPVRLDEYLSEITVRSGNETINQKTGRRIAALIPMHCFGHPSKIEALVELAKKYSIKVVEDAAESVGSYVKGQHTGTMGDVGVFSFNGNKIVTTGGGGAIVTDNEELGKQAKHITTTAKVPHSWEYYHDQVGFNFRMPNLNAALGCAQLESIERFLNSKRKLAESYERAFADLDCVEFVKEPVDCRSNYWLNAIILNEELVDQHQAVLKSTNESGIMTRPAWKLMHQLPMYRDCPSMDFNVAESIQSRLINIPSGAGIQIQESES